MLKWCDMVQPIHRLLCSMLWLKNRLKPIFNSTFLTIGPLQCRFAWCMGISLFHRFVVSSSYVIAFNIQPKHIFRAHFVLNCLCVRLIAMAVEGYINALNQHFLSLSLFKHSTMHRIPKLNILNYYVFCSRCFTHAFCLVHWFFCCL